MAIFCIYSGIIEIGQKHPPIIQVGVIISEFNMFAFLDSRINPATVLAIPIETNINAARMRKCTPNEMPAS
ncbi:hypothetical protein D3C73_1463550 [compost metagenome]